MEVPRVGDTIEQDGLKFVITEVVIDCDINGQPYPSRIITQKIK